MDHIKEDQLGHSVTWLLLGAKMKWPLYSPSRNHLTCHSWNTRMHAHAHTDKVRQIHTHIVKYRRKLLVYINHKLKVESVLRNQLLKEKWPCQYHLYSQQKWL